MSVSPATWQNWRVRLGASRREAKELFREYQELVKEMPTEGKVRYLKVEPWQTFEQALAKFLDTMPRKPYAFLARVKACEERRATLSKVEAKKARNRRRYLKRYARGADTTSGE